jgi:hypothetical protein
MNLFNKSFYLAAIASLIAINPVQAFEVLKAEDINNGGLNTHAALNTTKQKEQEFLNRLDKTVGTEKFESLANFTTANLNLAFPGAGNATLGGSGEIHNITDTGNSKIIYDLKQGLYSVSGDRYWYTEATPQANATFNISFSEKIAAFGFYAYDLGDWGAQLTIKLYSNNVLVSTINQLHTVNLNGQTTGSAIYVGILGEKQADGNRQTFDRVEFTTAGTGIVNTTHDIFAFDDMTIAVPGQMLQPDEPQAQVIFAD